MEEENKFNCTICNRDERLGEDWLQHLTSLGHQRSVSRRPGGGHGHWSEPPLRERSITIHGCQKVKASPYDIGQYVTKWGKLEEFICPTSIEGTKPDEIFCLFYNQDSVKNILEVNGHRISGLQVKIREKYSEQDVVATEENDETDEMLDTPTKNGKNGNGTAAVVTDYKNWGKGLKLEDQLTKLFQEISLTPKELQKRTKFTKELQEILRQTFEHCFVFSYGTDSFGLAISDDPIRFCVDPYESLGTKTKGIIELKTATDQMSTNLIFQILSTYQKDGFSIFKYVSLNNISPVTQFTVNQVSFNYEETICKVQFENFLSLQKSRLIKFLSKQDLRVWPLMMLVRHWSLSHGLFEGQKEGDEFENYTVILLLVFFLIKTKVIPSVAHLQSLSTSPLIINSIDLSFCTDAKLLVPSKLSFLDDASIRILSTLSILKEFFQFYSKLEFKDWVLCSAIGELIPRRNFKTHLERDLPELIKDRYRFSANGDLRLQKLNTITPMCLQDPLDLSVNVSGGVDEMDLSEFQMACAKTAEQVTTLMESSKPNLLDLFKNDSVKADLKRKSIDDEDNTLISSKWTKVTPKN